MERFIQIGDKKNRLTEKQASEILGLVRKEDFELADALPGDIVALGKWEFVVLEQMEDYTALILRELLQENVRFGSTNCYDGSDVDRICNEFAEELASVIGEENLTEFAVDLTSDDGLKDYGIVKRKAALLTTEMYRLFVDALDQQILKKWWWLATPHSTERHGNVSWVKCVSPRGSIDDVDYYDFDDDGVRPFCILKSNIFVSR